MGELLDSSQKQYKYYILFFYYTMQQQQQQQQENRHTIINRIYYLAYKYRIRDMDFIWDGLPFDPIKPEDQRILENATTEVLSQILNKYLEAKSAIYAQADDIVYRDRYYRYKRTPIM